MARTLSGTQSAIATAFATSLAFTAASNATETVLTVSGATLAAGDYVEATSTWGRMNNRIFRVKTATASAITLEGFDTTNTVFFPAGAASGSLRKVNTWLPITQQIALTPSGGDPKIQTFTYVETEDEQTIFDGNSATTYTIDLDADAVGSTTYNSVKSLSDARTITALRMTSPNGAQVLLSCTLNLNENPILVNNVMANKITFFGRGRTVRYAS